MVFSSVIFLMVFLPVFLSIYYLTPKSKRSYIIIAASYIFYTWWRVDFAALLALVTIFNFVLAKYVRENRKLLVLGVVANLLNLAYFKYFNFGVDIINQILGEENSITVWHVIMPLGVSFYTFQLIAYLIDVARGDIEVEKKFVDFAVFANMFAHVVSGPILRYKDMMPQIKNTECSAEKFQLGVLRFATGLCKKIFIADVLSILVGNIYALSEPTMAEAWLGGVAYTAQLFFDFSSYTDMAIGVALMIGFEYPENFNYPYLAKSINEFWQRWHITLSSWLKYFLYIPLGGNRKGKVRGYINAFITMLLSGLWHGANWTFILWGAWHAVVMAFEKALIGKEESFYKKFIALPLTFAFIVIGWVTFRAESISQSMSMYKGMFGFNGIALSNNSSWFISDLQMFVLAVAYFVIFVWPFILGKDKVQGEWLKGLSVSKQAVVMLLFVLAIIKMIGDSYSPFLYFDF